MTDLIAWLIVLLFPSMATAATGIAVLLSTLYVIDSVKRWIVPLERAS